MHVSLGFISLACAVCLRSEYPNSSSENISRKDAVDADDDDDHNVVRNLPKSKDFAAFLIAMGPQQQEFSVVNSTTSNLCPNDILRIYNFLQPIPDSTKYFDAGSLMKFIDFDYFLTPSLRQIFLSREHWEYAERQKQLNIKFEFVEADKRFKVEANISNSYSKSVSGEQPDSNSTQGYAGLSLECKFEYLEQKRKELLGIRNINYPRAELFDATILKQAEQILDLKISNNAAHFVFGNRTTTALAIVLGTHWKRLTENVYSTKNKSSITTSDNNNSKNYRKSFLFKLDRTALRNIVSFFINNINDGICIDGRGVRIQEYPLAHKINSLELIIFAASVIDIHKLHDDRLSNFSQDEQQHFDLYEDVDLGVLDNIFDGTFADSAFNSPIIKHHSFNLTEQFLDIVTALVKFDSAIHDAVRNLIKNENIVSLDYLIHGVVNGLIKKDADPSG